MTIARRLTLLVTMPLLILVALCVIVQPPLADIEARRRFVAETQIGSLAALGDISRSYTEMRVNVRSYLLAENEAGRARARAAFDEDKADLERALDRFADTLISDDKDRRLMEQFRSVSHEWTIRADEVMQTADPGQQVSAISILNGPLQAINVRLSAASHEWIEHNEALATIAGQASIEAIKASQRNLYLAVTVALAVASAMGYLTFRRIVHPIRALEGSVSSIAAGDYAHVVPFTHATDETGGLARSIDVLKQGAAATEDQRWVKSTTAQMTAELPRAASLPEFGQRLLAALVPMLGGGPSSWASTPSWSCRSPHRCWWTRWSPCSHRRR